MPQGTPYVSQTSPQSWSCWCLFILLMTLFFPQEEVSSLKSENSRLSNERKSAMKVCSWNNDNKYGLHSWWIGFHTVYSFFSFWKNAQLPRMRWKKIYFKRLVHPGSQSVPVVKSTCLVSLGFFCWIMQSVEFIRSLSCSNDISPSTCVFRRKHMTWSLWGLLFLFPLVCCCAKWKESKNKTTTITWYCQDYW